MAVSNSFKQTQFNWTPDADSVNAPEGILLRADNLVPDSVGAATVRRGSEKVNSTPYLDSIIHSAHTVELANGTTYRFLGIDDRLYINGTPSGDPFDGSGDLAMGNDSYQAFFARGTKKLKYDGTTLNNWGIRAPQAAPTLAAVNAITSSVAQFDTSESPAVTALEGTLTSTTDVGGNADSAKTMTPASSTGRCVAQRLWSSDQDFMDISGTQGSETDLFDISIKFENPRNVDKVKIIFGINNSSTIPFETDRFEFEFNIKDGLEITTIDPASQAASAYDAAVTGILNGINPADKTNTQTPSQIQASQAALSPATTSKVKPPPDGSVWGHLTVTRGQFERIGSTTGRSWKTVRGFKVVYTALKGYVSTATVADALFVGGGDRSLTGPYTCVIRAGRQASQYVELSPPSPASAEINLNHQTLQVTVSSTVLASLDPQVDQLWVYLYGRGVTATYYRYAITTSHPRTGMTIDEVTNPTGSDADTPGDRSRLANWGFSVAQGGSASATDLVMTIEKSTMDAIAEGEYLEGYQIIPPDDIVAIAGPWKNRMFVLTSEGYVYPSSNRRPSSFNSYQVLDLTKFGNPLWMVRSANGIYVGMSKDIIFLAGTSDNNPLDPNIIDLYPEPLNVGNPPVDNCVYVEGNTVYYRSVDGLWTLTSAALSPVPRNGTSLLWRGFDRHGIQGLNVSSTGRFRITTDNLLLYMLAPEGQDDNGDTATANVIYRYNPEHGVWSRFTFPLVNEFHSLYKEPDGTLIAGDDAGTLWQLETGSQDNGEDIPIYALTPIGDAGNPLVRKTPHDLQIHCSTGGRTGTVTVFTDGDPTEVASYSFSTTVPRQYRIISDFGDFIKLQLAFSGTFSSFALHSFDLGFRAHPQHMVSLDTGYLQGADPADLLWIQEIEFDTIARGDVDIDVYLDDTLTYSTSLTDAGVSPVFTAGIRTVYRIPLPRGTVSRRPRIVFHTTAGDGEGEVGFDPYSIRIRTRSTGNADVIRKYFKVWPASSGEVM